MVLVEPLSQGGAVDDLTHLTHWNHDKTRGVRIDRVYLNFDIPEPSLVQWLVTLPTILEAQVRVLLAEMVFQKDFL